MKDLRKAVGSASVTNLSGFSQLPSLRSFKWLSDQLARSKCLRKCSGSQKTAGWMFSTISARARTASFASGGYRVPLNWGEKLWDANCDLTANFTLSTQQTADFLVDKDFDTFNNFPDIDATVEKVLSEAEAAGPVFVRTLSDPASTNPPLPTNLVLSTQQIADFVVHTDFDDFPSTQPLRKCW